MVIIIRCQYYLKLLVILFDFYFIKQGGNVINKYLYCIYDIISKLYNLSTVVSKLVF